QIPRTQRALCLPKLNSRLPTVAAVAKLAAVGSDDALLGEPLDLARGAAEQLGEHIYVILAVAWRAAVDRAADIGRGPAELHRDLVDRPGADLGAGDLGQPFEMAELRVVIDAVLGVLAHPGGNAGFLQLHHAVIAILGRGPRFDRGVERVLVLQ